MEIKVSVSELVSLINEIQVKPGRVFEMVRINVKEDVGRYLTNLMDSELTHFLGRERYERELSTRILYKGNRRSRGKNTKRQERRISDAGTTPV